MPEIMATESAKNEVLYQERLARYVTALRNGKPDRVPIRPFLAEAAALFGKRTCQEVTHDYRLAFDAVIDAAKALDVDALVVNMVWVWTGLTEALGLDYYSAPGIHIGPETGFQYKEPEPEQAFMKPGEYGDLIADPTGWLLDVWLPRVARDVEGPGGRVTRRHNLALLRGGMNMLDYFMACGAQVARMRAEAGMPSAIAGILKAPMDIIADKLRGYLGLLEDLEERPEQVKAACEALAPHLFHVALGSSDPAGNAPIGFWMHRGCVPFVNPATFDGIYWPTLRPIIEELWAHGRQTLFYAEGNWDYHLNAFRQLPDRSIVYHVDRGDLATCHRKLGEKFCLSGGVPNTLLAMGTPERVRAKCREILRIAAGDGGFIMDASAIVQNDAKIENLVAMVEATREFGVYSSGSSGAVPPLDNSHARRGMLDNAAWAKSRVAPGVALPFEEERKRLPAILGDEGIVERIWRQTDGMANMFVWHVLLSF